MPGSQGAIESAGSAWAVQPCNYLKSGRDSRADLLVATWIYRMDMQRATRTWDSRKAVKR
jgi:hypothetical protein